MNLEQLRQWLIERGISPEELDEFIEQTVIRDIGEGLALSLMNDDSLGEMILMVMMEIEALKSRIEQLEGRTV